MTHQLITQNHFNDSLTQYGDGVFETMLAVENAIHHWNYHWARLKSSCERLEMTVPDEEQLIQQIQTALTVQNNHFSVVKMIISRGEGLRGYRSHIEQPAQIQFQISPYHFNDTIYQGVNVRLCQTRVACQPLLAGIKHCNRLEYIMARREPQDSEFYEGLLFDTANRLVEGVISNVFLIRGKRIRTPDLSQAGVAGTMRAYLLASLEDWGYDVSVESLELADIEVADGIFLSNATNGIVPVLRVAGLTKTFDKQAVDVIRQRVEHPCYDL